MLTSRERLPSVDLLRGSVMILMALDHTRDFFSDTALKFDPCDLAQTTVPLYFTRWVTHFCAPLFVFLAGTGAYLSLDRGRSIRDLSRFLLTRGVWLILLDPIVIRQSWFWDLNFRFTFGQVIWAIGWSMVVLAALIRFPRWQIAIFSLSLIAGHNLFDGVRPDPTTAWGMIWSVLHVRGDIEPIEGFTFWVMYPLIPWVGVLALGYVFGSVLRLEAEKRRRTLILLGSSLTAGFIVLRWLNGYGDPHPWSFQKNAIFTLMSFLNCEKYPPSLLYLLMTLGPAILALFLLDRASGPIIRMIVTFGRVPMFFYLIHVPFIKLLAGIAHLPRYGLKAFDFDPFSAPPDFGFGLPVVYAVCIVVVILLYFPCLWFAGVKSRRRNWWLGYL